MRAHLTPSPKNTWNLVLHVSNLYTFSKSLSHCPNGNQVMESHGRGAHYHVKLSGVSLYQATWAAQRKLLLQLCTGRVRLNSEKEEFPRRPKDELHFRHGYSCDVRNQTLVCPALCDSVSHGSDLPGTPFLRKAV